MGIRSSGARSCDIWHFFCGGMRDEGWNVSEGCVQAWEGPGESDAGVAVGGGGAKGVSGAGGVEDLAYSICCLTIASYLSSILWARKWIEL